MHFSRHIVQKDNRAHQQALPNDEGLDYPNHISSNSRRHARLHIRIAELMSHLLPFKQRHGLQMTGVREHVEHAEAHQTITPFHQHLTVPRQGDRVTGDVDHPLG